MVALVGSVKSAWIADFGDRVRRRRRRERATAVGASARVWVGWAGFVMWLLRYVPFLLCSAAMRDKSSRLSDTSYTRLGRVEKEESYNTSPLPCVRAVSGRGFVYAFFGFTCTAQITVDPHFARCSGFARLIITTGTLYRSAARAGGLEGRHARELGLVALPIPRMPCRTDALPRTTDGDGMRVCD